MREEAETKLFKKLGKSRDKAKVRKRSPNFGVKLVTSKIPSEEILNEAMENLSSIKETFSTSKDYSKSLLKFTNQIENANPDESGMTHTQDNQSEHLNDSFGEPKTNRSSKWTAEQHNEETKYSIKREEAEPDNLGKIFRDSKLTFPSYSSRDDRLELVLECLNLENLNHIFLSNKVTLNDLLFLSKEDLLEMNISLVPRNRILNFSQNYKQEAKDYSHEEILDFFRAHKNLIFSSKVDLQEENWEADNVCSTANFNSEVVPVQAKKSNLHKFGDEVLTPSIVLGGKQIIKEYCGVDSSYTLANYVGKSGNKEIRLRSDSKEKASQTKHEKGKENIICNSELYKSRGELQVEVKQPILNQPIEMEESKNEEEKYSKNVKSESEINPINNSQPEDSNIYNSNVKELSPLEQINDLNITQQESEVINSGQMLIHELSDPKNGPKYSPKIKRTKLIKDFDNVTNQVEDYIRTYKEQKIKSEDRINRLKCLINKSRRKRSKSEQRLNQTENKTPKTPQKNHLKLVSNSPSIDLNQDELKIEEERNLNEELTKILNRINYETKDSLRKVKSKTNLYSDDNIPRKIQSETKEPSQDLQKLYELWNYKENLQANLARCNMTIIENKKLVRLLEDSSFDIESSPSPQINKMNLNQTIDSLSSTSSICQKKRMADKTTNVV